MKGLLKKRVVAAFLMLAMLATVAVPVETQAAAKVSKADFTYKVNGKTTNFVTETKDEYSYYVLLTAKGNKSFEVRSGIQKVGSDAAAKRGIRLGSSEAKIKKAYGKATKKSVTSKETFLKEVKYNLPHINTSEWKSYLDYTYKEKSGSYRLRFYLNNKNKLVGIAYFKNFQDFRKYPDKELKSGFKFIAPKGKKIKTETIDGNTVYLVPSGSKYYRGDGESGDHWMYLIGTKGQVIAQSDQEGTAYKERRDISDLIDNCYMGNNYEDRLNLKKVGKYKYFCMVFVDIDGTDGKDLAPQRIYFKIV